MWLFILLYFNCNKCVTKCAALVNGVSMLTQKRLWSHLSVFEEVQGDLYVLQLVEAHAPLLPGLGKTRWQPLVAMGDGIVHKHENRQQREQGLMAERV